MRSIKVSKTAAGPVLLALLFFCFFNVAGCGKEERKLSRTIFLMDTHVDVTIYSASTQAAQTAMGAMFEEMQRLEGLLSRHIQGSDLHRINAAAGEAPVQVRPETIFVLKRALEFAALSEGAFDPTVAPLLELWGFGGAAPAVPSVAQLARALELVDYRMVELDEELKTVFLPRRGMKLDLGGIAKGYIVDRGLELARGAGSAAFINAGGDISVLGRKPGGGDWRIGVQDPRDSGSLVAIINLDAGSVATSGDYQRFFEVEGERFHHILDPDTGMPASGLFSVSIVAPDATTADALATSVFVLGQARGMALVEGLPGVEALIVNEKGELLLSSGLDGRVEIPSK